MVYVGLSGGIDSAYALYLLKKDYQVTAFFLIFVDQKNGCSLKCCNLENVLKITKKLEVKLEIVDVRDEFKKEVIEYFVNEYKKGRTPNPCVVCNEKIKVDLIIKKLLDRNDFISTGHYANIIAKENRYYLKKGLDKSKDQSYMLYRIKRENLSKIVLPLGLLYKKDIIENIKDLNLFEKIPKESQDLCFLIGKKEDFIKEHLEEKIGNIYHISGKKLGTHKGYYFYTIGQREGLNISWSEPLYVLKIDPNENVIIVAEKKYLMNEEFIVKNINWLYDVEQSNIFAKVKTRYKSKEIDCEIRKLNEAYIVKLFEKEFAITPGQSAVFYKDDFVLGGGIIDKVIY